MPTRTITQTTLGERRVDRGRVITLSFRLDDSAAVPAILQLPDSTAPVPGALLLHGWSSNKEQMAETVGRALLERGIASLAIDLPLHGDRSEEEMLRGRVDPLRLLTEWKAALEEGVLALRYLSARAETDRQRLALVGYSLGSYVALAVAARESRARAVVLAAGGDLPTGTPFTMLVRTLTDPLQLVRRLNGRPLLMMHGRQDRTILPEQAERLFNAAAEPKSIRWWDAGHYLPRQAIDEAAEWLQRTLTSAEQLPR
jgi:fermentation-respiration switch protein FrsA (DUF1100 family)